MCITLLPNARKRIAVRDITVYKVIMSSPSNSYIRDRIPGEFFTSYQKFPIEIGETYEQPIEPPHSDDTIDIGFHSYVKLKDAHKQANYFGEILAECIVPKGSEYYVGVTMLLNYRSIVSNQIKYVKILENFEEEPEPDPHEQPDMELT